MDNSSGVGVLDKAALVLAALGVSGPATLAGLVAGTGLARPTAHRLAVALEHHRLVARDMQGRFVLGPRLAELSAAAGEDRLLATAGPVLARLRDITGESAQLWRRQGEYRVCVAAAERPSGLRDTIPIGSQLTMRAGSAAQVLLAWEDPERMHRGLQNAAYSATALAGIRRRGWAQSVGEREQGVASVSAPVRSPSGKIIAAVSVSGPLERLSRQPGRMHAPAVLAAAERLSESLRGTARPSSTTHEHEGDPRESWGPLGVFRKTRLSAGGDVARLVGRAVALDLDLLRATGSRELPRPRGRVVPTVGGEVDPECHRRRSPTSPCRRGRCRRSGCRGGAAS